MAKNKNLLTPHAWDGEPLAHPALQALACTMEPFNYDALLGVYHDYNLQRAHIVRTSESWLAAGIVTGEPVRAYGFRATVRLLPEKWPDVIRTINPGDVSKLQKYGRYLYNSQENEAMLHFITAVAKFAHNQSFLDELKAVNWNIIAHLGGVFRDSILHLISRQDFIAFSQFLQKNFLVNLFFNEYLPKWRNLNMSPDEGLLNAVFFDNPEFIEDDRNFLRDVYLYNRVLIETGEMDKILAKMQSDCDAVIRLRSLKYLHEGEAAKALKGFTEILDGDKALYFADSLTNFAYALALGLVNDAKARKTAEKLMKKKQVIDYKCCYAMLMVLHTLVRGDIDEYYRNHPLKSCKNKMDLLLASLFLRHYHILDPEPEAINDAGEIVSKSDFVYLKRLFCDDFDQLKPLRKLLCTQTGITSPLMPEVKITAQWERVIDQILKINSTYGKTPKKSSPGIEQERVIYMLDTDNYTVRPKLQKSKDGGKTWSKGRYIALKNFGFEECLNPQDRKVASLVDSYNYGWGGSDYSLEGTEVLAALAGCPRVFSEQTGGRIDIVEEPLQLQVLPYKDGFSIRSNINTNDIHYDYCVTEQGDKQITVTHVSDDQLKILKLLRNISVFPAESKSRLTAMLQELSSDFTVMSPLMKNATDLKRVEASPLIAVQIAPDEDQEFSIHLAVKPFGDNPPYQKPGKGMEIVSTTIDGERVQTERDMAAESRNETTVTAILSRLDGDQIDDNHWLLDTAGCLGLLEQIRQHPEAAYAEWPQGVKMRVLRPMIMGDAMQLKISSAGQWFELEGDVKIGEGEKMKIAELMERLRNAEGNFIRLEGDEFIAVSEQLRRQLQSIEKMLLGRGGKKLKVAAMNAMQLTDLEEAGVKLKADKTFREMIDRIREADTMTFRLPANIHAELRPYQEEGYRWMSRLAHWGAGACLADDMGLGKTLQSITLMQSRASLGPQLVLMPTSVLLNWQQELMRFAPALTVKVLNAPGADRERIVKEAEAGDVVLATYGLLVTEGELLASRTWTTITLDEAHSIKNRDTQTSKSAMNLKGDFRLMLTGTPVQNHLSEIWNLFQFANPGLLGSFQQFSDRFILPIERDHDQERQRLLRRILSPFLLRRTKEEVLNELPEKTDITLRVELSEEEKALYDNLRQQAIANLEEGSNSTLQALAEITRLRQAACHPRLVNAKLDIPSSKTQAFLELVANLRESGHRALVFSQFTSHLALVREELDKTGIPYLYLDGSTTAQVRSKLVKQFQTGDEPLFLISLKAGGLGLNLTAADYVIHLDPWWNPAIEDQASDRAHRLGQQRPVTVYRLIAAGTIEEKILRLHQNKRSMADALLQDADLFNQISADDVIRLLRETVDGVE